MLQKQKRLADNNVGKVQKNHLESPTDDFWS
jgi:hypothetical protein